MECVHNIQKHKFGSRPIGWCYILVILQVFTTGQSIFAEGPGHSAKALPSAALGKEPSEKNLTAKRLFAEGHLSGTRQSLFRGPTAALGKEKQPSTALLR